MLGVFNATSQTEWEAFKAREVERINRPAPAEPTPEAGPEGMDDDAPGGGPPDAMEESDEATARRSTRIRQRTASTAGPTDMP
eukprot:2095877-Rhodomonas_salina.1